MKALRVLLFLLTLTLLFAGILFALNRYPETEAVQETVPATESVQPQTEAITEPVTEVQTETEETETEETESATETEPAAKDPASVRIAAVGDIMFHTPQLDYAASGSGHDFSESFALISPLIQRADFAIGNFETTSNEDYDWFSYPQFNTPPQAIDAIRDAGFDALSTANNHTLDTYQSGVVQTRRNIMERGLIAFGTREEAGERIEMTEVNGIPIALLAYTYGFNGLEYVLSDEEYIDMVNPLDPEAIREDIEQAKERGAELVIIYPHWGIEYSRTASEEQETLAHQMIDWGADLVLGSHPHVVQTQEWVQRDDGTRAYIIYSMGNFISGQRLEYNEDIHVEQSVLLDIVVSRDEAGRINVDSVDTLPLWVDRTDAGLFRTVHTQDALGPLADSFADWKLDRIRRAQEDTDAILTITGADE